jgi:hypothetical protein
MTQVDKQVFGDAAVKVVLLFSSGIQFHNMRRFFYFCIDPHPKLYVKVQGSYPVYMKFIY